MTIQTPSTSASTGPRSTATRGTEIPLLRIPLDSESSSELAQPSRIMVDKLTTMPRSKLGQHIGEVSGTDRLAFSRALVVFLGLA